MLKRVFLSLTFLCIGLNLFSQKKVAITIDDVPNTRKFHQDNFQSVLLNKLDTLNIPVAIFINEGHLYQTDSVTRNFVLLNDWIKRTYVTPGNHTFAHSNYSKVGIDSFKIDITKGERNIKEMAHFYNKPITQFRFPFNSLGNDSVQHYKIEQFLSKSNYDITPFTIESADWMFNSTYKHYLDEGKDKEAKEVAHSYIALTLDLFDYFDSLSLVHHKRNINHIYLCHDNEINADYLDLLVTELRKRKYSFISLNDALRDPIYESKIHYFNAGGISWYYRWIKNEKERNKIMKVEPFNMTFYRKYKAIKKAKE